MNEPKVTDYNSGNDFLKDYYLFRKMKNRNFSYEKWAREISYPHRSNLRLVINGTRSISIQLEECFQKNIFKTSREKQYFKILCEIRRTKTAMKREALEKKAFGLKSQKELVVGGQASSTYDVLESLYLMVLLGFSDVDRSAEGLANLLKMDKNAVAESLQKLQSRGLVRENSEGKEAAWSSEGEYTIFKDDPHNELLAKFHKQSFLKAIAAQTLPKNKRRFDALVLPLSPQDYGDLVKELEGFLDKLFYKYNVNELKGKDLYQIQIGTFPAV